MEETHFKIRYFEKGELVIVELMSSFILDILPRKESENYTGLSYHMCLCSLILLGT